MGQFPPGKYAGMVKMGEKGQIVIPKEVRDMMGFRPGDTILLLCDREAGVAIPPSERTQKVYDDILSHAWGEGERT